MDTHDTTNWIIVETIYGTIINNDYVRHHKFSADDSMKNIHPDNTFNVDPFIASISYVLTHI